MAYVSTTDYVTRDTYYEFSGIDLDIELKSSQSDNPTRQVAIFIRQQQIWLYNYMLHRFDISKWDTDWDDDAFSSALLWQIKHILNKGEDGKLDMTAYHILRDKGLANPKWIG